MPKFLKRKAQMRAMVHDAFSFFAENPKGRRSIEEVEGGTMTAFRVSNGNCCCIGMQLTKEELDKLEQEELLDLPVELLATHMLYEELPIAGFPTPFLVDMQALHDTHAYWEEYRPTEAGVMAYARIVEKIRRGKYTHDDDEMR
jgi:hypothetical protein